MKLGDVGYIGTIPARVIGIEWLLAERTPTDSVIRLAATPTDEMVGKLVAYLVRTKSGIRRVPASGLSRCMAMPVRVLTKVG